MNKKAQSLSISTIVIIVLAVIVLVVLVLGFTTGWGNLWGRISSFFGDSNVDSVVQACNVACTTESRYDFCEKERILKGSGFVEDVANSIKVEKDGKIAKGTCSAFAKSETYGVKGFEGCGKLCPVEKGSENPPSPEGSVGASE